MTLWSHDMTEPTIEELAEEVRCAKHLLAKAYATLKHPRWQKERQLKEAREYVIQAISDLTLLVAYHLGGPEPPGVIREGE